jgi:hypothetical protein
MSFSKLQLLLACIVTLCFYKVQFAQGLEGIVVEQYYQSDAADEANASSNGAVVPLTQGSITYRVYVDMADGYKFSQVFGTAEHNLLVNTTTNFYNDPNYGVTVNPATISTTNIRKHTAMIDSWFTTGGTANSKVGVMKTEDIDGTLGNQQNILANNPGGCIGLPINGANGQDGMVPSSGTTYLVPNQLGIGSALQVLDQTAGNSILIDNGAIAALGGIVGPTASNRVLIAQFTTSGDLTFQLNVQIVNIASGAAENYVASDPVNGELTHPSLIRGVNVPPSISITSPIDNANINTGSNVTIVADVNDPNGTITVVEFFIDGVSIGTDNSSPYTANYTAVAGNHTITATATDPDCVSTSAIPVDIIVSSNQPPVITLTAPTSVIEGTTVTFSANASDPDGSIALVEFFVNNVSIGTDNTSPYSIDYTPVAGTGQSIKAEATDNLNATTTSNIITMNVVANTPPSVSITSPLQGDAVIAPADIEIQATATDIDGTIVQVEFFVNGISIGTDTSAPYLINWTSIAGSAVITSVATDSNGANTTSASVTILVVDPNALPYYVGSSTINCDDDIYCIPFGVSITSPVDNIIGYDITINYDPAMLEPTGSIALSSILADPQFVEATVFVESAGVLEISLNFNGGSTEQSQFVGAGQLFCIEFTKLGSFPAEGQSEITAPSVIESYISGVVEQVASSGYAYSVINTQYHANLQFWSDQSAIAYDSSNPNDYLITKIYGAEDGVINESSWVVPDLNGNFTHDLLSGPEVSFERDINNIYTVQPLINAADAVLCKSLSTGEFTPNVYQIMAMDVNLDGVVSAGDITQLKQRATLTIGEFQQAWNYDDNGNSNGEPSKDWIFIDSSTIANDPAFQLSANFPSDDGVGYSASRVPAAPFTLPANVTNFSPTGDECANIQPETYVAILLGDITGSYADYEADGQLKSNSEARIIVDLNKTTYYNGLLSAAVYISSENDVNSIDLALEPNAFKVSQSLTTGHQAGMEGQTKFNDADRILRTSYFNQNTIDKNFPVFYIQFASNDSTLRKKDFNHVMGLLNGLKTEVIFLEPGLSVSDISLYPVPNNGHFTIDSKEDGSAVVYNSYGQIVQNGIKVSKGQNQLQMTNTAQGVYSIHITTNTGSKQIKFIVQQ